MKRYVLLTIAFAFALSACSSDDTPTVTLPSGGTLSGTWSTGCLAPGTGSNRVILDFSGSTLTFTQDDWNADTNCTGASNITENATSSFVLGGTTTASGQTATQVDITDTADTVTLHDSVTVSAFNGAAAYGFTNWEVDVAQDVLGLDGITGNPVAVTEQNLFAINEATSPDQFFVGITADEGGPVDADGYPTTLNTLFILSRQ